jgi:adenylate kinase
VRRVRARRICRNCGRLVSAFSDQTGESDRCANCGGELVARSDDAEAVVRDRLKVYWQTTKPMIAFYQGRPTYRIVDGAQSPEQVRDDLVAAVASALGRPAADLGAGVPLMRPEKNA